MQKMMIKKLTLDDLPSISIKNASIDDIANCITNSSSSSNSPKSNGILVVEDLPIAPFDEILDLLQPSEITTRINEVFKDLDLPQVYNDNKASSKTSTTIQTDRKISLDLSLDRIETIQKFDPNLLIKDSKALQEAMNFYKDYQEIIQNKLMIGFATAIGLSKSKSEQQIDEFISDDITYNYRMIDYYPCTSSQTRSQQSSNRPRLKEHRDFGFITLIQATSSGLQIKNEYNGNKKWVELPAIPKGSAILMFGWCGQIKSNSKLPAILHRINNLQDLSQTDNQQHRVSAVMFINPKRVDTLLDCPSSYYDNDNNDHDHDHNDPTTIVEVVDSEEQEEIDKSNGTTTTKGTASKTNNNNNEHNNEHNNTPPKYKRNITAGQLNKVLMESKSEKQVEEWLLKVNNNNKHKKKNRKKKNTNNKQQQKSRSFFYHLLRGCFNHNHNHNRNNNNNKEEEEVTTK